MARSRKTAPVETPVETTETDEQVAADMALANALGLNQNIQRPQAAQKASLGDNFVSVAAMIAEARKSTRLSEATLIKVWEFTLMWALNNRSSTDLNSVFPEDPGEGDVVDGDNGLPEPNEILGADDTDSADTTEE